VLEPQRASHGDGMRVRRNRRVTGQHKLARVGNDKRTVDGELGLRTRWNIAHVLASHDVDEWMIRRIRAERVDKIRRHLFDFAKAKVTRRVLVTEADLRKADRARLSDQSRLFAIVGGDSDLERAEGAAAERHPLTGSAQRDR